MNLLKATKFFCALPLLTVCAVIQVTAATVTNYVTIPPAEMDQGGGQIKMTEGERRLVEGSRRAILETGFSAPYFEEHFRLVRVIDKPGDRRVVWRFSIGEYEANVNDAIGYYTSAVGIRVDVHSAKTNLGSTRDILVVIPRKQAEKIMHKCIGKYTSAAVELNVLSTSARAGLFMTAISVGKKRASAEGAERDEKRKKNSAKRLQGKKTAEVDEIESEEGEGGLRLLHGVIDLETGKCTKGEAIASPWRK